MNRDNARITGISATIFQKMTYLLALGVLVTSAWAGPSPRCGLMEVSHKQVEIEGGFWGPRLQTHHDVTVPHALDCLERNGHVTNYDKAGVD